MSVDYQKLLLNYQYKTITKEALQQLLAVQNDYELHEHVAKMCALGYLRAFKQAESNGNHLCPLYAKYHILLKKKEDPTLLKEIGKLHPALRKDNYFLTKPQEYRRYRSYWQLLDAYLFHAPLNPEPISRKERSFMIFKEEKVLDERNFTNILAKLGLNATTLAFYDTPEDCFHDYIPVRKERMVLLILENKDIWFDLRRYMFTEGCRFIFATAIDGVVYGSGNKVTKEGALSRYGEYIGSAITYLYWGDIDRAGFNIYLNLKKANPQLAIKLFVPAYRAMLKLASETVIPDSQDRRGIMADYQAIYALFTAEEQLLLKRYISANKLIPQEIINYAYLRGQVH